MRITLNSIAVAIFLGVTQSAIAQELKLRAYHCDTSSNTPAECARLTYYKTSIDFTRTRDVQAAIVGFTTVLQFDTAYAPAHFNLGVLAEATRDWAKAHVEFNQYLMLAPHGEDAKRASRELNTLRPYAQGLVSLTVARAAEYDANIARARILLDHKLYKETVAEAGRAEAIDTGRWEAYAVVSLAMTRQSSVAVGQHFAALALERVSPAERENLRRILTQP